MKIRIVDNPTNGQLFDKTFTMSSESNENLTLLLNKIKKLLNKIKKLVEIENNYKRIDQMRKKKKKKYYNNK